MIEEHRVGWSLEHWTHLLGAGKCGGRIVVMVIGGLLAAGSSASTQSTPADSDEKAAAPERLVLRDGRPVSVVVDQTLSSGWRKLYVGQVIKAHVETDIEVNSQTIVSAGAPVELRIRHVRNGQLFHGRGQLLLEAVATRTIDRKRVVLRGGLFIEGRKHLVIDYIPLGYTSIADLAFGTLFQSVVAPGGNAKVHKGTTFEVTVDGDHSLDRRAVEN